MSRQSFIAREIDHSLVIYGTMLFYYYLICWRENFILSTLLPRRQHFLTKKISFSTLLLPRRHHFLTRKFYSRQFNYLVDSVFFDEKIIFSTFLLPRRQHFLTRKFHFRHCYYLVDIISWGENFILGNLITS